MQDSEIAELCQRIYHSHQRALDLIFEHRPDEQAAMAQFLSDMVASEDQFLHRLTIKQYVHFTYREWDALLVPEGEVWSQNGGLLYFQFQNLPDKVTFMVIVGPGPQELRSRLITAARGLGQPFRASSRQTTNWMRISSLDVLGRNQYASMDIEERRVAVQRWWGEFLRGTLPVIVEKLSPAVVDVIDSRLTQRPPTTAPDQS